MSEDFPRAIVKNNNGVLHLKFMKDGIRYTFMFQGKEIADLTEAIEAANNEPDGTEHRVEWDGD